MVYTYMHTYIHIYMHIHAQLYINKWFGVQDIFKKILLYSDMQEVQKN
jgi:hypothetical protein